MIRLRANLQIGTIVALLIEDFQTKKKSHDKNPAFQTICCSLPHIRSQG